MTLLGGRPLSARASRVLLFARELAEPDEAVPGEGEVDGGVRLLARVCERTTRSIERALRELERKRPPLAWRAHGRVRVALGDDVKTTVRVATQVAPLDPSYRRSKDKDWKALRAKLGGMQRAYKEKDEEVRELREKLARAAAINDGGDPQLVALLRDVKHAASCFDLDCDRCEDIVKRVEAARPRYENALEQAHKQNAAELAMRAASALLAALRSRAPGARSSVVVAASALELVGAGDLEAAQKVLGRV
jgi:hypothetical protein